MFRKFLLFVVPVVLAFVVFLIIQFVAGRNLGEGALQITSNPASMVYLDGKFAGQTPFCKCEPNNMIKVGEYTLRLVPQSSSSFSPFEGKINISKSVLTVVDRNFGKEASSDGSIIGLTPLNDTKSLELLIVSFPDNAEILVDSNFAGRTPLLLKNLTESDHEIKIVKNGYKEKIAKIHTVKGYKLTVETYLGINPEAIELESSEATPAADLEETESTSSAKVTILQTPTGFLRVRNAPSISGLEIARVVPGEFYEFISEEGGWYQIKLKDGKIGWVSSQYAQKQ